MALKRTRVPFYGKRETRLHALAERAHRDGNIDYAQHLHDVARGSLLFKRAKHARRQAVRFHRHYAP